MTSPVRPGRLAITLTAGERDALAQLARHAREPEARTAARLLRHALADHHGAPLDAPSQRRTGPRHRPGRPATPDWLPATKRLFDIEALRARYPRQLHHLPPDPLTDPAIAEPVAALTVWRERLDHGHHHDPRDEIAFADALHRLAERLSR